jgi:hypothetical protein
MTNPRIGTIIGGVVTPPQQYVNGRTYNHRAHKTIVSKTEFDVAGVTYFYVQSAGSAPITREEHEALVKSVTPTTTVSTKVTKTVSE